MKRLLPLFILTFGIAHAAETTIPLSKVRVPAGYVPTLSLHLVTKSYADGLNPLPSQTGNSGKYLKTNGTITSWDTVDSLPPQAGNSGKVLYTNGTVASWSQLTLDQILAAFAVSSFSCTGSGTYEIGQTWTAPVCTIAYNRAASASVLSNSENGTTFTLSSPFTSGTYTAQSYTKTTPNASVTLTVTANEGGPAKTSTTSASWRGRVYYGIETPGTINEAFIESLASTALASSYSGSFSIGAGNNTKRAYYCIDSSFGTPGNFKDGGGFAVPMTAQSGVSVTNGYGVARTIVCYMSDNLLNTAFTLVVS